MRSSQSPSQCLSSACLLLCRVSFEPCQALMAQAGSSLSRACSPRQRPEEKGLCCFEAGYASSVLHGLTCPVCLSGPLPCPVNGMVPSFPFRSSYYKHLPRPLASSIKAFFFKKRISYLSISLKQDMEGETLPFLWTANISSA